MIFERIQSDLKSALKKKEKTEVGVLRFLLSEIRNRQIALRPKEGDKELSDEELVKILRREIKRHKESIEAYQQGKRDDLVKKEREEMKILKKYLPQEMPAKELEEVVKETISQVGASGPGDFGKVMGLVMSKVKGKIGGEKVAEIVKRVLSSENNKS